MRLGCHGIRIRGAGVKEDEGMAGHPLGPFTVHAVLVGLVKDGPPTNIALVAEAVHNQVVAQHPVHNQPFPQGLLAEHHLLEVQ